MYDFSKKLKLWAIGFMVVGAIGIVVGFMAAPSSVEEVKEMLAHEASHGGGHGSHDDATNEQNDSHGSTNHEESNGHDNDNANKHHDADHEAEHILGQLQNKPWSALYVACFFFMMISFSISKMELPLPIIESAIARVIFIAGNPAEAVTLSKVFLVRLSLVEEFFPFTNIIPAAFLSFAVKTLSRSLP